MPRGIELFAGMAAFLVAVVALIAYFALSGAGGKQRGLVFRNLTLGDVLVTMEDGQSARLAPSHEQTLAVRRERFPETIRVMDASGRLLYERRFTIDDLKDYRYHITIGDAGFLTPVPTPPGG